ncbi:MAG: glutamine synthetase [Candidatus Stahlbacteria bacterium]|nr:glutamine synthetase [Candidatus Stahlbacteria bacterium]
MNFISQAIAKPASNIRQEDIENYIKKNGIQILNLCYIGSDSRLKSVSFPTTNSLYIGKVLSRGERRASVFLHSEIKVESTRIIPKYQTAFLNPFAKDQKTLNILCECRNKDGDPLTAAPSTVLDKAIKRFKDKTGFNLTAAGELEYFVLYPKNKETLKTTFKHYDATAPFTIYEDMRNEIVQILTLLGIPIKYAHSESGKILLATNSTNSMNLNAEQHEIEFLPTPIDEAADDIVIAKWVTCNVAQKYGVSVTFSPVVEYGKSGNGLHFHLELIKEGKNIVLDENGNLTTEVKRVIGGILLLCRSLCAFGNPVPTSYLRLIGKKETPYGICWGERTRKAVIRIPEVIDNTSGTIEFRTADTTAVVHLLLAGLTIAAENGLTDDSSLEVAEKLHSTEEEMKNKELSLLPQSCREAANKIKKERDYYEKDGIFPTELIDSIIHELKSYEEVLPQDEDILRHPAENIEHPACPATAVAMAEREKVKQLIEKYIYYYPFSF